MLIKLQQQTAQQKGKRINNLLTNSLINKFFINKIFMQTDLKTRIEHSLDGIRPHLISDGGNVEIVSITADMVVQVKLIGACETCPISFMTLKSGIEQSIKMAVPEIKSVVAI